MDGRAFLAVAQRLASGKEEADWRTAAGRAYFALAQEAAAALQRWGVTIPKQQPFHAFVRLRFVYAANHDLATIGRVLDGLSQLRAKADYQLEKPGKFASANGAHTAILQAQTAIVLLDAIDADPTRRSAAVADVHKTLPPTP